MGVDNRLADATAAELDNSISSIWRIRFDNAAEGTNRRPSYGPDGRKRSLVEGRRCCESLWRTRSGMGIDGPANGSKRISGRVGARQRRKRWVVAKGWEEGRFRHWHLRRARTEARTANFKDDVLDRWLLDKRIERGDRSSGRTELTGNLWPASHLQRAESLPSPRS